MVTFQQQISKDFDIIDFQLNYTIDDWAHIWFVERSCQPDADTKVTPVM